MEWVIENIQTGFSIVIVTDKCFTTFNKFINLGNS